MADEALGRARWSRYQRYLCVPKDLRLVLDISRVNFDDRFLVDMQPSMRDALDAMSRLEAGAVANPDEGRMVGHYWLRAPERAPTGEIAQSIIAGVTAVREFARAVRSGAVGGPDGTFQDVIHVGIGGSAVGPQLLCDALDRDDGLRVHFVDNADPDGLDRTLGRLRGGLGRALVSVVSKSGYTPTPLWMLDQLAARLAAAGLDLARQAVATTLPGSGLEQRAVAEKWLRVFPIWEWVGGRTSVTSAVGLLPAALAGADIDALLDGAARMDDAGRCDDLLANPAALLALMWYHLGGGHGSRDMVVLPYRDRLALLPRYVQQLVMESVGKRLDRRGRVVEQGMTVYGHKGSSDQHAYLQQLRDGRPDFFVTFVAVRRDGSPAGHLLANLIGTRDALHDRGRDSITITVEDVDARSLGALIALFERATGLYAELIDVNAYHQPGVDKHAAAYALGLRQDLLALLGRGGQPRTAEELALALGRPDDVESAYLILDQLAADQGRDVRRSGGPDPGRSRFIRPGAGDG